MDRVYVIFFYTGYQGGFRSLFFMHCVVELTNMNRNYLFNQHTFLILLDSESRIADTVISANVFQLIDVSYHDLFNLISCMYLSISIHTRAHTHMQIAAEELSWAMLTILEDNLYIL